MSIQYSSILQRNVDTDVENIEQLEREELEQENELLKQELLEAQYKLKYHGIE